jgi:hypothetical protein
MLPSGRGVLIVLEMEMIASTIEAIATAGPQACDHVSGDGLRFGF